MLSLPVWLHETLAIGGVVIAGTWLVLRLAQIGRPREVGCARCPSGSPASVPSTRGVRSKQLRVLR
jgi:hypothetical protein